MCELAARKMVQLLGLWLTGCEAARFVAAKVMLLASPSALTHPGGGCGGLLLMG